MAEFWILDAENTKLGLLQDTFSVMWMPRYSGIGTAEIHARPTADNLEMLRTGNIIVNMDRKECCFIQYRFVDETAEKPEITIRGVLEPLGERINIKTFKIASIKNLIDLVYDNLRGLDLAVSALMWPDVAVIPTETTWENVADTVTRICHMYGYGFRVVYAAGIGLDSPYVLEFYLKDKNPLVRFSDDLGNVIVQSYEQNREEYANFAYVAGEGEDADRVVVTVDISEGEDVRELYVDARDLQRTYLDDDGNEVTVEDVIYKNQLRERGLEALAEVQQGDTFNVQVNTLDSLFRLGIDYDIGDIVHTSSVLLGVEKDFRIEGLNIVYEKNELIELVLEEETEGKTLWLKEHFR